MEEKEDKLIKAIKLIPVYQPIPTNLFRSKERIDYFTQRNTKAIRTADERDKLINLKDKSVLDIGCNIGYFGWNNMYELKSYIGIDADPECIKVANMIKRALRRRNMKFICADIKDILLKELTEYYIDVCLFFSIYHHLLYQVGVERAREIIKEISKFCDVLYFDMGQKSEPVNSSRIKWHSLLPDEDPTHFIRREILINTTFKYCEVMGETRVGNSKRILFRFTK